MTSPTTYEWARVILDAVLSGVIAGAAAYQAGQDARKALLAGIVAGGMILRARITPAPGQQAKSTSPS